MTEYATATAPQGRATGGPPSTQDGGAALFDWFRRMRDEQPVWRDQRGIWHVFRYDDVTQVLSDFETFSSDRTRLMPAGGGQFGRGSLTMTDPPRHRKLRRLINEAFTPRTVAGLAPRIEEIAGSLLADLDDECDFMDGFAYPLPVIVVAELLGVPLSDRALFRKWADGLMSMQVDDLSNAELFRAVNDAMSEMNAYMLEQCRYRRTHPGSDLISTMAGAEVDGERLDDEDIADIAGLLLLAGHITTTMLLGNAVLCLRDAPDAEAELRTDHDLIPAGLEEVLRLKAPFTQVGRISTIEVELSSVTVPANSFVMGWLLSANHDERRFPDPARFDIHRQPNRHCGFGQGIHFCIGAPLARVESRIALTEMFRQFSELRPADGPLTFHEGAVFGVRRLPVRLRRR